MKGKVTRLCLIALVLLFIGLTGVHADTRLPAGLTVIQAQAFENNTSMEDVTLPDGLKRIESRAFAGSSVGMIYMPESIEFIAPDAFDGCENVVGWGVSGTYAEGWCGEHNVPYEAETHAAEDFVYVTKDALTAKLTGYVGTAAIVVIPGEIDGYYIDEITDSAFRGNSSIHHVTIPAETETINANAFRNCTGLKSVTLNEGLVTIGNNAFTGTALSYVAFPRSLKNIGGGAFSGCTRLAGFSWPYGLQSTNVMFEGCTRLTSYTFPQDIKAIPNNMFKNVGALSEIHLAEGLETIGNSAFEGTSLSEVAFPSTLTELGNRAFNSCAKIERLDFSHTALVKIGSECFAACTALTDVNFHTDTLNSIEASAFSGCVKLKAALLPDSVSNISTWAFRGCEVLSEFTWPMGWKTANRINSGGSKEGMIFQECKALRTITVPEGVTAIPTYALKGCNYLRYINLPSTLTAIGDSAFEDCTAITAVDFPNALTYIGKYAFSGCSYLKAIDLTESALDTIDIGAFRNCVRMTAVELPDSVTHINTWAFSGCTVLSSFTWPLNWTVTDGINSGGWKEGMIFQNCEALESITVPEGVTAIPACALKDANYLRYINLPTTLTAIGDSAFRGCTALTAVDFPNALTRIGKYAFKACSYLKAIDLTKSALDTIDVGAFSDCIRMTAAELPDSVTHINTWAFSGCTVLSSFTWPLNWTISDGINSGGWKEGMIFQNCEALESITVPEGVAAIPACALEYANCLRYVELPSTLTEIKNKAFKGCASLEELDLSHTALTRIGYSAFENCSSLIAVDLPDSVTYINTWAFCGCASLSEFTCPMGWTTVEGLNSGGWKQGMVFKDCAALTRIVVPQGAAAIPAYAFTNLGDVEISIPDSVITIGNKAFLDCGNIILNVISGSYAETYATENGINYRTM